MQHQVFKGINKPQTWFGIDRMIYMIAGAVACVVWLQISTWYSFLAAIGIFLCILALGYLGRRYDPQFLSVIPIEKKLKRRYEAGPR